MNREYLNEVVKENRDIFIEKGLDVKNGRELEEEIMFIIQNGFKLEYNIDLNVNRLFNNYKKLKKDIDNDFNIRI